MAFHFPNSTPVAIADIGGGGNGGGDGGDCMGGRKLCLQASPRVSVSAHHLHDGCRALGGSQRGCAWASGKSTAVANASNSPPACVLVLCVRASAPCGPEGSQLPLALRPSNDRGSQPQPRSPRALAHAQPAMPAALGSHGAQGGRRRPPALLLAAALVAAAALLPSAAAVKGISEWNTGFITHYGGAQDGEPKEPTVAAAKSWLWWRSQPRRLLPAAAARLNAASSPTASHGPAGPALLSSPAASRCAHPQA